MSGRRVGPPPTPTTGPDRVPALLCGCGHTRGSHVRLLGCLGCTGPLCDPDLQAEPVVYRCGCGQEFASHAAISNHDRACRAELRLRISRERDR